MMMFWSNCEPKTFHEYREEHADFYKDMQLDPATQKLIDDYFYFRHVGDEERFPIYFKRTIDIYHDQYTELLRMQKTTFDPMVSEYLEQWAYNTGTSKSTGKSSAKDTSTGTNTVSGTSSSVETPELTTTRVHEAKTDTTRNGQDTAHEAVSENDSRSGENVDKNTGERTTTNTGTQKTVKSGSGTETETPELTTVTDTTGSGTSNTTTNTTSNGNSDTTVHSVSKSNDVSKDTKKALNGVLPDSSTYEGTAGEGNIGADGMPNVLTWQYADNQSAEHSENTQEHTGDDTNTTTQTQEATGNTTSEGETSSTAKTTSTQSGSRSVQRSDDGTDTRTDDLTNTVTDNTQVTHVIDETHKTTSDKFSDMNRNESENVSTGGNESEKRTGSNTVEATRSETVENNGSRNTEGTSEESAETSEKRKAVQTGRHEAPQDMLKRAQAYIKNCNAFLWLAQKIDPCFSSILAVY